MRNQRYKSEEFYLSRYKP